MKKIINYFSYSNDIGLFEKQKMRAYIFVSFFMLVILSFIFVQSLLDEIVLFSTEYIVFSAAVFIVVNLFVLKKYGIRIAGNSFSLALVLFQVIALSMLGRDIVILSKYLHGFYLALAVLVISVLFASRVVLILNTIFIFLATTRVYIYGIEHFPEQKELLSSGYFYYIISLLIILFILYFTARFGENAINEANENAKKNEAKRDVLLNIVIGLRQSSEEIYKASSQLSEISQQISQNANEQAATTEEISASMEQLLAIINSNTGNAEITGKSSAQSAEEIKKSNEIFIKAIDSVSTISDKILIISEIAAKTDILSINAAIEAARGGEVGKGFAVVAQEIRKLADKTRIASEDIIKLSEDEKEISKMARINLEKTIPKIVKSAELVKDIVAASKEQQSGVVSINSSVLQLSEITNENSAAAEEMSASAEGLAEQAKQLLKLVESVNLEKLEKKNIEIENTDKEYEAEENEKQEVMSINDDTEQDIKDDLVHKKTLSHKEAEGLNIDLSSNDSLDEDFENY